MIPVLTADLGVPWCVLPDSQFLLCLSPPTQENKWCREIRKKNPRGGVVRNCNKGGGGKYIGNLGREGKGREVALRSFILCTEGSGNCDSHQLYLRVGDRLNFIIYSSAFMFM